MTEYVNVRASEVLDQGELVSFLKSRFPSATKPVGRPSVEGTECVEVRVPSGSAAFEDIRRFINAKRERGLHGYSDFTIGWYLRKYTKEDLQSAEVLRLTIASHFEPSGEECGTIYETLCPYCNWGRQASDLILAAITIAVVLLHLNRHPRTDDASVRANYIQFAPEVSGRLVTLAVKDNAHVNKGDLLFAIDSRQMNMRFSRLWPINHFLKRRLLMRIAASLPRTALWQQPAPA